MNPPGAEPFGPVGPGGQAWPTTAELADAAAAELVGRTGVDRHEVAVILGSGWKPAAELIGPTAAEFPSTDLPGFAPPAVEGHAGVIRSLRAGADGRPVLAFLGRTHLYEGHGPAAVAHSVRTAVAAGCRIVVLTNGCGSLRADWAPGTPVLIADHVNLTGASPLLGARFVDLTDLYSRRLRDRCRALEPDLPEGVYAGLPGPQYETPAEIRMLRTIGADLVGMSTVLEAIAAREAGAEVLGLSLVTNAAAGMTGQPLSHAEVLEAGRAAAQRMGTLLARLVTDLPRLGG